MKGDIIKNDIKIDIIIVTYNSIKWISNCLNSICKSNFPIHKISVIVVDNGSSDEIENFISNHRYNFGSFKFIRNDKNEGFGKANNIGAKLAISDCLLFLNPDTELHENAIKELIKCFDNDNKNIASWELRQFPFEHPKYYNPITLETSWSSMAACMVRKSSFDEIRGFDKNIHMYCEDVDLSWRLRLKGYKLKYIPRAIVYHFTYNDTKIKPVQFYNSIKSNIYLRYKFGSFKDILAGYLNLTKLIIGKEQFPGSHKGLLNILLGHILGITPFIIWKLKNWKNLYNFNKKFLGWDYEIRRDGDFYINKLPETKPLVSIIVRTIGRPSILKETLTSIRNQTYENIETIIIEDGPEISSEMIKNDFHDLNIKYFYTGQKKGRCKAGNIGLEMTNSKYTVFLDDDDVFFSDHIEVLVSNLDKKENKNFLAAYCTSFETPIKIKSVDPYIYKELSHDTIYRQPFNRLMLFHHNYIPIQTIMFNRELYLKCGGFDESLELLEDWDLWVRYCLKTDFIFIPKCTSMYRVPGNIKDKNIRHEKLHNALELVRNKNKNLEYNQTIGKLMADCDNILNNYPIRIPKDTIQRFPFVTYLMKVTRQILHI